MKWINQRDFIMDNIFVCWVESDNKLYDKRLYQSCERLNITPTVFGRYIKWKKPVDKIITLKESLNNVDIKEDYILFIDSRDVLFYKGLEEIEKRFKENFSESKVIFNAETNCYPFDSLEDSYPNPKEKYRFLNSGMMIGKKDSFIKLINEVYPMFVKEDSELGSDQGVWTKLFLKYDEKYGKDNPIGLDYNCKIFQVLWDEHYGRSANFDIIYNSKYIYNRRTNTEPCIFHMPGPTTTDSQVWKIINNRYGMRKKRVIFEHI